MSIPTDRELLDGLRVRHESALELVCAFTREARVSVSEIQQLRRFLTEERAANERLRAMLAETASVLTNISASLSRRQTPYASGVGIPMAINLAATSLATKITTLLNA